MSEVSVFHFDSFNSVRVLTVEGEPWFNANDVCEVLKMGNSRQALDTHVDDDDVQKLDTIDSLGRSQLANHVNESGLYALILGSKKPEAKKFKKWVTSEVIPSIRKTGSYSLPTNEVELPSQRIQTTADWLIRNNHLHGTERANVVRHVVSLTAPELLPLLPAYATNAPRTSDGKLIGGEGNSRPAYAASALLKKFSSELSIRKFNSLAEQAGILETVERPSTKHVGVQRTFKRISEKGLRYGYNLSNEHSKGSVQPVWFAEFFEELLDSFSD